MFFRSPPFDQRRNTSYGYLLTVSSHLFLLNSMLRLDWPGHCTYIVCMFRKRSTTLLTKRVLASLVGMMFFVSMVAAQVPHCQCGIWCLHLQRQVDETVDSVSTSEDHGCCPSERQGDAPAPEPVQDSPCGYDEGCPCPVEINSSDQVPAIPLSSVINSVEFHPVLAALPENFEDFSKLARIEDAPRWRPTRGSPTLQPPLYALNSTYII